ncbi:MAG: hypothetical protein WKG32_04725 [Gemmatimonadaceae bacterium]
MVARRWWRLSGAASALLLLAPVSGIATTLLSFEHPVVAIPRAANVAGLVLVASVVAGLPLVIGAVVAWRRRFWTVTRRVHFSLVAAALLVAFPLLAYWRVLGLAG